MYFTQLLSISCLCQEICITLCVHHSLVLLLHWMVYLYLNPVASFYRLLLCLSFHPCSLFVIIICDDWDLWNILSLPIELGYGTISQTLLLPSCCCFAFGCLCQWHIFNCEFSHDCWCNCYAAHCCKSQNWQLCLVFVGVLRLCALQHLCIFCHFILTFCVHTIYQSFLFYTALPWYASFADFSVFCLWSLMSLFVGMCWSVSICVLCEFCVFVSPFSKAHWVFC